MGHKVAVIARRAKVATILAEATLCANTGHMHIILSPVEGLRGAIGLFLLGSILGPITNVA
ncbi:hypothetical protein JYU04_00780 [Dehalococcoides mccartyi]|nr:hypothetical protein [Dehalococcoides mccartyi]